MVMVIKTTIIIKLIIIIIRLAGLESLTWLESSRVTIINDFWIDFDSPIFLPIDSNFYRVITTNDSADDSKIESSLPCDFRLDSSLNKWLQNDSKFQTCRTRVIVELTLTPQSFLPIDSNFYRVITTNDSADDSKIESSIPCDFRLDSSLNKWLQNDSKFYNKWLRVINMTSSRQLSQIC